VIDSATDRFLVQHSVVFFPFLATIVDLILIIVHSILLFHHGLVLRQTQTLLEVPQAICVHLELVGLVLYLTVVAFIAFIAIVFLLLDL